MGLAELIKGGFSRRQANSILAGYTGMSSTYGLLGPVPSGDITGVTDRVAIQALLTLAGTTGVKVVQLRQAPSSAPYWVNTAVQASDANYQTGLSIPSGVTLRGQGMDATWIRLAVNSVGQASLKGSNIILNGLPTAGTDTGCRVENLTVDGNAANQTDLFNGVSFIRGRSHGTDRVRVKNVRGTASSGAAETFHFMFNACAEITQTKCEAVGDAGSTASGFASNGATNLTRTGCTARGMTFSQGFTDWKSGMVSNIGCVAYGNAGGAGFNAEDCDDITYSACHSGGKAGKSADGFPFTAGATLPGNYHGFTMNGSNRFALNGCTARFNISNGLTLANNYTTLSGSVDGGSFSDNAAIGIAAAVSVAAVVISPTVECLRNTTAGLQVPVFGYGYLHGLQSPIPAVPASAANFTNPFPTTATVVIFGGTMTSVLIQGFYACAVSGGTFRISPGATINLTYTVAPSWVWYMD